MPTLPKNLEWFISILTHITSYNQEHLSWQSTFHIRRPLAVRGNAPEKIEPLERDCIIAELEKYGVWLFRRCLRKRPLERDCIISHLHMWCCKSHANSGVLATLGFFCCCKNIVNTDVSALFWFWGCERRKTS